MQVLAALNPYRLKPIVESVVGIAFEGDAVRASGPLNNKMDPQMSSLVYKVTRIPATMQVRMLVKLKLT